LNDAAQYIEHGWKLCKIPTGTKGPRAGEWQKEANAISSVSAFAEWTQNVGLLHTWSRTCALDIDKYPEAREWLAEHGIQLDALLSADDAVQICSGREGRAKLLFRVPDDIDPLALRLVQIKDPLAKASSRDAMWLEFRCSAKGGVTVQDVLPPSIHPDTGKPYTWGGLGHWQELPALPAPLLTLWLDHADHDKPRKDRQPTGPGTGAAVLDFVRRLQGVGCKPYRSGTSFRSHCPKHGGASGTTLKIDESADGQVLADCKAGCSFNDVTAAMGPRDAAVVPISNAEGAKRAKEAKAADIEPAVKLSLPSVPRDLLQLPYGLGVFQEWILGYQTYPSAANAGLTAIATLAHFAMANVRIDSLAGLGLNEQYLVLAPTGAGKEDLRRPFALLDEALRKLPAPAVSNLWHQTLPQIQYSAPASQQGLHRLLEQHRAQAFLADEFADWLGHTANDSHKYQAMSHLMQAYSKAFGTLAAPAIADKDKKYLPVKDPRVLVFATSTAERMLETITASQADSGALNRFVTVVAEQDRPQKRYGLKRGAFAPPPAVVQLVRYVSQLKPDTLVTLSEDAWHLHDQHDCAVLEPLKFADPRLAGRLNEQALKIAALVALSDRRTIVEPGDLAIAYAIREGLYHRTAALVGNDGALSGLHNTGRALEQIKRQLQKHPFLYRSNLPKISRPYAGLALHEQRAVERAIGELGYGRIEGGRIVSMLHQEAA
jgi:hypothetical protein